MTPFHTDEAEEAAMNVKERDLKEAILREEAFRMVSGDINDVLVGHLIPPSKAHIAVLVMEIMNLRALVNQAEVEGFDLTPF